MIARTSTISRLLLLLWAASLPGWANAVSPKPLARATASMKTALKQDASAVGVDTGPPVTLASTSYVFSTATNASLTDMSTGTTLLIGAGVDDGTSGVKNIGFDFYLLGARYSQFSVNSNGYVRLGATGVGSTQYSLGTAGQTLITGMGSDLWVSTSGKVHYKVIGTAPNRELVVEFLNITVIYDGAGTSPDATYQVHLHESTGVVDLVYGSMKRNAGLGFQNADNPQFIGFSVGGTAGTLATIDTNNTLSTASATANHFTLDTPMASLTSSADGSRRIYTFAPPTPTAPTSLSFTGVTPLTTTLNWVDSPDEALYAIYNSVDGTNFNFVGTAGQNATSFNATGLNPSTTYFWRVYAVSDGALSSSLNGTQATPTPGNIASTATGGFWSSPSTWTGGVVPTNGDAVTITDGAAVVIDTAAVAYSVSVGTGAAAAVLQWDAATARTLTVGTNVSISTTGSFVSAATGTVTTHVLSLGGSLSNAGVLDFSTNTNTAGAGITFTGANNASFSGAGTTTDVRTLTVNKGATYANTLELNPTNFTWRGTSTDSTSAGFLTLIAGTLKISGTFSGTARVFTAATYTINGSAGLWLNNPNFVIAGQAGSPALSGLLHVSQGTYNVGTAANNTLGFNAGSTIIVDGGAITTSGRFGVVSAANTISYTQTAGTITVCTLGNASGTLASFDLGTSLFSTIAVSGGTVVLQLAATLRDYRNQAGNGIDDITGGILQLGNASSGAAKTFNLQGEMPNIVVTNTSANHKASLAVGTPNYFNATRNITLNTGTTLTLPNDLVLFEGTLFTNNGTLVQTAGVDAALFLTNDGAPITYTGTGTVTAPLPVLALDTVGGVTFDASVNPVATNYLVLFSGNVTGSNKITLGNGGTTSGIVQIGNTTTPTPAGSFDQALTLNLGSGGETVSYLRTTTSRSTGPEIPATRSVTDFTYDDDDPTHALTIAGGDLAVTGSLALTNGRVITANTLIADTATVSAGTGYVDGNLRKVIAAAGSQTFEVGSANGYSPASVNATAGTFPATVSVRAAGTTAPSYPSPATALSRYWQVTASDLTADLSFTYLDPEDLHSMVVEADLQLFRQDAQYTNLGGSENTGTNTISGSGISTFGVFTAATPSITDLGITLDDGVTTVNTGGVLTYLITASNNGPANVTSTPVSVTFAPDLTCSWTCTGNGGGTCTASGAGNIYQFVSLPPAANAVFTATCAVATTSTNSSVVTTATIVPPPGFTDTVPANDNATDTDALVRLVDLSISKTDAVNSLVPGAATTYQIVAANGGPNTVATLVTDTVPASLTACTWTCSASTGTCGASGTGNISDVGSIGAGGSLTYALHCSVAPSATGSVVNTATVAANEAGISDTSSGNDSATDTDMLTPQSDVAIGITDNRERVRIGDSLNYTVTVSNSAGPSTAVTTVSDVLPAALSGGSWVCIPFGGATCANGFGNALSDVAHLPPGSTAAYVYTASVLAEGTGVISNSASATTPGDTNPANNSATDTPPDSVVIFVGDFEGTPLQRPLDIPASDFLSGQLRANPALLDQLGLVPVQAVRGESASDQLLFAIEMARFNHDVAVRVITLDPAGVQRASSWQNVDLAHVALGVAWQASSSGKLDGYVAVSGAAVPLKASGLGATEKVTRLIFTVQNGTAWMNWTNAQ